MKEKCKKWAFQLERGDDGYEHWQGRFSLNDKTRDPRRLGFPREFHFSVTANENKDSQMYVFKSETRILGPWCDRDKGGYIPRQVMMIKELYPWQQQVIDSKKWFETRWLNIIVDTAGKNGKSTIKTWVGCKGIGRVLPYCTKYLEVMRMVMDIPKAELYIIDLPRALPKHQMREFYAGIESVKDGYAFDDRYKFKDEHFDCPTIWVFTNSVPDVSCMTEDRWKYWTIDSKTKTLVEGLKDQQEDLDTGIIEEPLFE